MLELLCKQVEQGTHVNTMCVPITSIHFSKSMFQSEACGQCSICICNTIPITALKLDSIITVTVNWKSLLLL